jgi:pimeloyl-ACP methyl ester carboxylesterase
MPLYMRYNADLENHFTVVYWDQRGSGKSYSARIPPESMTLDQFVADMHELTNWLRKQINKTNSYWLAIPGADCWACM